MIVTTDSPNRRAYLLLGCALAISVFLAFPMEQVTHKFNSPGSYWILHSCEGATTGLNLGNILQAILTPIFVFLLPAPGSIFQTKVASSSSRRPSLAGAPAARIPATSQSANGARRSTVAVAVFVLVLCLAMFLWSSWALKHWTVDHLGAQSPPTSSSFANAAVAAFLIVRLAFSLVGVGAAIYLLRSHVSWEPALFIAAGGLCAAVVAVAWWYGLREYAGRRGVCPDLFDLSRSDPSHVDYLADCAHYFICLSGFSALWVGVTAGGLRLQSARAAEGGSARNELRQFQGFYWACFLAWAVQYRISQWFALPTSRHNQEWVLWASLDFVFLTASSLWTLAFVHSLWKKKPRTWLHAVVQAFWRTFVIILLTTLAFCWLFIGAAGTLKPFVTWNVFGLAWALSVGTWRWRALQKQLVARGR